MAEQPAQRRLTAILAADVVGYSRLMGQDEAGTLATLKARRKDVLEPLVAKFGGRIFKLTGDGVLMEFGSAVNAVQCAIDLQQGMAAANRDVPDNHHIVLRIGINLDDVMVEGDDLYGDGVNIAARLEAIAEPGSILLSAATFEYVKSKLKVGFDDLGLLSLKNIAEQVRAYSVAGTPAVAVAVSKPAFDKPSIAVLPFTTMAKDPDQEIFADGLAEDLITDLSRNSAILVTARNSCFAYKGKSIDVRRIAGELGVRYVLEGSARRQSQQVRINVQLIDAATGNHLWAERYDRSLEDIFSVQDEVTAKIVEALAGRLMQTAPHSRPKSLEAWDCCVKARRLSEQSPQAAREARLLLERALELDPDYAEAHRWLAMNLWVGWVHWGDPIEPSRTLSMGHADRALALDPRNPGCHSVRALILQYERRFDESEQEFAKALELDPNDAECWGFKSDLSTLNGNPEQGLAEIEKAFRLNPIPQEWYYLLKGQAQYALRQYEAAIQTLRHEATYRTHSRRFLAASLAQLGRIDEARREAKMFMVSYPAFRISYWAATQPFQDQALLERFVEGYRKAGLPE
jgi:TolB-like protein